MAAQGSGEVPIPEKYFKNIFKNILFKNMCMWHLGTRGRAGEQLDSMIFSNLNDSLTYNSVFLFNLQPFCPLL